MEKKVIKVSCDLERAKSLILDSEERITDANLLDVNKFSKIIFENYYDALRDLCEAILLSEGYKS